VVDEKRPQHENQTGADRVRHVPDRHLGRQFVGRDPVGHQRRDGRHAHALEIAVQQQDRTHDDRQRRDVFAAAGRARDEQGHFVAEPEPDVDERAERQAQRHEFAGAHPIGDESVDEPRNAVDDAVEGQEDSELRLGDAEGGFDARHGGVEVLAHEIIKCVTEIEMMMVRVCQYLNFFVCSGVIIRFEFEFHCRSGVSRGSESGSYCFDCLCKCK